MGNILDKMFTEKEGCENNIKVAPSLSLSRFLSFSLLSSLFSLHKYTYIYVHRYEYFCVYMWVHMSDFYLLVYLNQSELAFTTKTGDNKVSFKKLHTLSLMRVILSYFRMRSIISK